MVVDNRGILPASYSISSVRHALRASAGVIDIVVPCRWSDSPLPLVRRPIGPKYHYIGISPMAHCLGIGIAIALALVRKPIALVRSRRLIGPKKCQWHCHAIWHWSENHWHWSENNWHWSEKACHWSENPLV